MRRIRGLPEMVQRYLRQVSVATQLLAPAPTGAGGVGAGAVGSAGTVAAGGAALGLECRVGHRRSPFRCGLCGLVHRGLHPC
jgi:hypothetical protein